MVSNSKNPFSPKGREPNIDGNTPKVRPVLLTKFCQFNDFVISESINGVKPL